MRLGGGWRALSVTARCPPPQEEGSPGKGSPHRASARGWARPAHREVSDHQVPQKSPCRQRLQPRGAEGKYGGAVLAQEGQLLSLGSIVLLFCVKFAHE